ncbi:hypothetical protein F0562_030056 [Nyssa sinensis]|uniref:Bulb-type lectin domain-containing protein n=1 Tax=Nyssa sinensis TaxID=561372 RepID=A0A5J5AVX2_9ASTE|nr:hypothetical protein F0562_030056 [Nyssa sinensis]
MANISVSHATDTLGVGDQIRDYENLESSNKLFQLRFFSPGQFNQRYLGILISNNVVVWVANPDKPISDISGVLKINQDGNLLLSDRSGTSIILNFEQPAMSNNTSATLLDSGNLILKSGGRIVWQSFDNPFDILLPGMKLGLFDLNTKWPHRRFLTSWVSPLVPSPGAFTLGVNPNNTKELLVWQRGVLYWRSGNWKGNGSSGFPNVDAILDISKTLNCSYFLNENESYFTCSMKESDIYDISGLRMDTSGEIYTVSLTRDVVSYAALSHCDTKGHRSKGCATPEPSNCKAGDMFNLKFGGLAFNDHWENNSLGISDCKEICRRKCSCNAYAPAFTDGRGCKFSIDTIHYYQEGREPFYIRNNGVSRVADTLGVGDQMRDYETLESSNKRFQLRFFNLGQFNERYLGIHLSNNVVVWVANPDKPISDTSGVLKINQDGNLLLSDQNGTSIILNFEQLAMSKNTSATLLDSGNLVLKSGGRIVWQSFDYPFDILLPGMKLGLFNLNTKRPQRRFLTSWVSQIVPSPGAFTLGVNPNNMKELLVWQRGVLYWRSGNWKGNGSSDFPNLDAILDISKTLNCSYFLNENESYFTCSMKESDIYDISGLRVHPSGEISTFSSTQDLLSFAALSHCDTEGHRSKGCATPVPSNCKAGDMFNLKIGGLAFNDYWENNTLGISDCKEICRRKCSCNAYAPAFSDGRGCKFSIDTIHYYQQGVEPFYIRNNTIGNNALDLTNVTTPNTSNNMSQTPNKPNNVPPNHPRKRQLWLIIGAPLASSIVFIAVFLFCYLRWKSNHFGGMIGNSNNGLNRGTQLLMNELSTSVAAIDEFSDAKMPELLCINVEDGILNML